jgi:ABC-2 type transport system ATP-binding protein
VSETTSTAREAAGTSKGTAASTSQAAGTSRVAVAAESLGKRFGRQWAVARANLEVREGEVLLLAGANGSGKTTLLRLLGGLHRPSAGQVRIFGYEPRRERLSVRRLLSLVSHDNYLYPPLTALETVRLWARLTGRPSGDDILVPLLEEVELADHRHHRVGGFSAGMRKRLSLARTRLEKAPLLLFDEPLGALDTAGQSLVERWIGEHRDAGGTVIVASHAVARMGRLCDRAVLLEHGQIAWMGPAAELAPHLGLEP